MPAITSKPLQALTAADLMSRDVICIPQEMSLRAAARLLDQAHISGAPVVGEGGRCIGVLSSADFLRWAEGGRCARYALSEQVCAWQIPPEEEIPQDMVKEYMTPDPVMTPPGTSIRELARMMIDSHVHRVVVVDSETRPIGIISSTDLLAALAFGGRQ